MKTLKPLLILLLVWTFSVQAIGGASGLNCRHTDKQTPATQAQAGRGAAVVKVVDPHAMHHGAGHAGHVMAGDDDGATAKKPSLASLLGCGCGCHCVNHHCASPAAGIAGHARTGIVEVVADSLRPAYQPANLAGAHPLDLIRPPSIT